MILRLTCPECKKDSYSSSVELFKPCPYCGILFSGQHGIEKRNEFRIKKDLPIMFSYKGKNLEVSTLDFSEKGLSIRIHGQTSPPVGDFMDINLGDSFFKAEIIWVFSQPDKAVSVTGLKILDENLNLFQQ